MKFLSLFLGLLLLGVVAAQDDEYDGGEYEGDEYGDDGGDYGGDYGDDGDYGDYGGMDDYGGGGGGEPEPGPDSHIVGVIDLDDKTFDKVVTGSHHVFVEFYAPWCGHCKSFSEEYQKIAQELGDASNLVLVKVDADSNKALGERFGVEGFPTMMYLAKDTLEKSVYEGERTSGAIIDYLSDLVGGVGSVDSLSEFVSEFVTSPSTREASVKKMADKVSTLEGSDASYGAYYLKVTDKVKDKGDDYPKTEAERLQRMIANGGLRSDKESEFRSRISALKMFIAASTTHTEL